MYILFTSHLQSNYSRLSCIELRGREYYTGKTKRNMILVIFFYLTTRSVPWCAAFAGHGISERVRLNRMVQAKGDYMRRTACFGTAELYEGHIMIAGTYGVSAFVKMASWCW